MKYALISCIISLIIALVTTPFVIKFATKHKIVAPVGGRRIHSVPIPLMGGIGIYLGFVIAVLSVIAIAPNLHFDITVIGVLVAGSIIAVVGLIDDKYEIDGKFQLLAMIIAAVVLVIVFGHRISFIRHPFPISLGWASAPITIIWIVMATKAFDCIDGLDGLAGGIAVISSAALVVMALMSGRFLSAVMAAALFGGALGFLRYNYPPAKIFMGTIGSQFLGFMLATIPIAEALKMATVAALIPLLFVLFVPVSDTSFVVFRRFINGKKIYEPDKTHLHHRLQDHGYSARKSLWIIYIINILCCIFAFILFLRSM